MTNETINDAWKDLQTHLVEKMNVPEDALEHARHAFFAGSWSTYLRFERAAVMGPAAVHTMMDETRAEFAEYHQRMRDKR